MRFQNKQDMQKIDAAMDHTLTSRRNLFNNDFCKVAATASRDLDHTGSQSQFVRHVATIRNKVFAKSGIRECLHDLIEVIPGRWTRPQLLRRNFFAAYFLN
jgi:hypothetical protein